LCNLPGEFLKFWTHDNWASLSKKAKLIHIIKKSTIAFLKILLVAVSITLVTVAIIASAGLLKHKAVDMFHVFFQIGEKVANGIAWTLVILGSLINSLFTAATTFVGFSLIQSFIKSVINVLLHPKDNYDKAKQFFETNKSNSIQFYERVFLSIEKHALIGCALVNCVAQGIGGACDKTAQAWTRLPNLQCTDPAYIGTSGFLGSFGANAEAILNTIEEKEKLKINDQNFRFFWRNKMRLPLSKEKKQPSTHIR